MLWSGFDKFTKTVKTSGKYCFQMSAALKNGINNGGYYNHNTCSAPDIC
jgi:hypothetical protein